MAGRRDDPGQDGERRLEIDELHRYRSQRRDGMKVVRRGLVQAHDKKSRSASDKVPACDVHHGLGRLDEDGLALRPASQQELRGQARSGSDVQDRALQVRRQQIYQTS